MQYLLGGFLGTFHVIVQLKKKLERIMDVKIDDIKSSWSKWAPRIFEQARVEASTSSSTSGAYAGLISIGEYFFFFVSTSVCSMILAFNCDACSGCHCAGKDDPLVALAMLVYLVPDSRSKPDHSKVLQFNEVKN